MSDEAETPREEAARIRRRWINLGELLAVAAVAISGLTLWLNWSERRDATVEQTKAQRRQTAQAASIALGGAADEDGRRLEIASLRADQSIQGQTIRFPAALSLGAIETTGDARIEADWIEKPLRRALKGAKDGARGDRRLPVLITTRFWSAGEIRTAIGLYDVGYRLSGGGLLDDRDVRLTGLSYIGPATPAESAERLQKAWVARSSG